LTQPPPLVFFGADVVGADFGAAAAEVVVTDFGTAGAATEDGWDFGAAAEVVDLVEEAGGLAAGGLAAGASAGCGFGVVVTSSVQTPFWQLVEVVILFLPSLVVTHFQLHVPPSVASVGGW